MPGAEATGFSRRAGMHRPTRFWAGGIESSGPSGRFSVEPGTTAAAPFPAPLLPLCEGRRLCLLRVGPFGSTPHIRARFHLASAVPAYRPAVFRAIRK